MNEKYILKRDRILDLPKSKALSYDKTHVVKIMQFVFDRYENIVGTGENVIYQHFLFYPQGFQKGFYLMGDKSRNCMGKGNTLLML